MGPGTVGRGEVRDLPGDLECMVAWWFDGGNLQMLEDLEKESCVICEDALDGIHQTSCQMCGGKFHQPWSQDSDIPRCGRISSHEEALAIVYLCNDCYEGRRP